MKSANDLPVSEDRHKEWIPPLDLATREVFKLMLDSELAEAGAIANSDLEITSMVGLAGALCGVLSVRCSTKAAAMMSSKMLGVPLDTATPEKGDALGEVCNMVAGNFKNKISGLAEGCMLSPPTVIVGSNYEMHSLADPPLEVRLAFENLPLVIALHIHSTS